VRPAATLPERSLRLAHLAASVALSYPDESLPDRLPSLRQAVATLPDRLAAPLRQMLDYLATTAPSVTAAHYVDTFDLRRRCCLYLTYYTHGDTRRRGLALLRFREVYREAGLELIENELPDHLAVVLELSAAGHSRQAIELLVAHRPGLELLWQALDGLGSPYRHAVAVVRASLPPPGPADLAAARLLADEGPPAEQVGLAPAPVALGMPTVLGGGRR